MRTLLVVLFLFFYFILSLPYLGIEWLLGRKNHEASDLRQLRYVQWAFRVIMRISGIKLTVIGEERVPKDEAVLYVCNHRSILDIVISYERCPRLTGYISKDIIKRIPILHLFMKRLHCLFLDRKDAKQGLQVILSAIDKIKQGISICIFPEGTRNRNEELTDLLPFKEGSMKIASKTGCRIVPMAVTHTEEILETHFPWLRRTSVTLTYGEPIDPKTMDKDTLKHLGAYCREIILDMLRQMQETAMIQ